MRYAGKRDAHFVKRVRLGHGLSSGRVAINYREAETCQVCVAWAKSDLCGIGWLEGAGYHPARTWARSRVGSRVGFWVGARLTSPISGRGCNSIPVRPSPGCGSIRDSCADVFM
ncbi:unnamed protein product [Protopolystoma xenopodis]|uniref:Uncharacterized protein n=1 Tax=Protopolystoma xenopodis TaxID=117903 RepID=A0A448WD32_9PLAT|nr:unnamed protein product [Protopolystoma xenopodis]